MSSNYNVRPYQPGDELKIIPLLDTVMNGWPKVDLQCTTIDHWNWLYLDNPEKVNPTVIAEKDGEIIGVNHGILLKVKVGKQVFLCIKATDLAVHPNYRQKGVSNKIGELQSKRNLELGDNLSYYLTKNPIVINSNLKKGGKLFPGEIKTYVRVQNISKHLHDSTLTHTRLQSFIIKYGFITLKWINKIKNNLTPEVKKTSGYTITKITKFDEKINTFWNKIKDQYNFIVVKDKNYLNWRYCDLRGGDYEIRVVEENENILGYIVLRINRIKNEYPLGYIMEILTLPEHRDVAELLIKDAAHYFEKRSINSIHATIVKGHPSERLLRRYDFIDNREKIFVGVNPNNPENLGNELENFMHSTPDKLNYQYGESDTI